MKITEVRAITCDIPLSRPIVMGELRYDSRDYILVEVRTDAGISGVGFGMGRYAPVARIVARNLTPLLLGEDPLLTEQLWDRLYYRNLVIGQQGIFMRALSAIDIALWDIKGKVANLPVWQLLGGARREIPAEVAGGYALPGRTLDDLGREVAGYAERGFRMVKIAAGDITEDTARLQVSRAALGTQAQLMYDAHWAWRDLFAVAPIVRGWDAFDLAWIEDPFPSEFADLAPRLRAQTGIPLAIGEDYVGRWSFRELFRRGGVDVVRLDATTMGGLSEAARVCALAGAEGLPVSPHIFPELHVHLGAAFPHVLAVEVTDPAQEIDVFYRLCRGTVEIQGGLVRAPATAGLGVDIDWAAVARYAVEEAR
ncbi:MAG TPA: mandelate racemase/muconate lactonizing enzyme family protein [Chloroflexota bacterium]|nr:mandelate racemase/muconate lactonizing enzyme family protein [Chloroflexota bacterium]